MKKKILGAVQYVFLSVGALLVAFPLLFTLVSSLKTNEEIFGSPWLLPESPDFSSYTELFTRFNLHVYFFNSMFYAVAVCVVSLVVVTMAAYGLTRMKWRFSRLAMGFLLTGIMVPLHAILVPLYITVSKMRIPNQFALTMIFIASAIPTSVFLISGFLKGIPRTIEESAVIDGAGLPRVFISIVCPMITPVLATVTIFNFMSVWNDLMLSLIFLSEESKKTLQLGILRFQSAFYSDYGMLLSAIVVAVIPTVVVYLFMSERIINGITAGAVKG